MIPEEEQKDDPSSASVEHGSGIDETAGSFLRAAARAPGFAAPSAVGRTLGRYRVIGILGKGGMGVVYEAHDTELDRAVALKCLPGEMVADPSRRRRFLKEALVTAGLEHPGIIPVHDAGESNGELYYAMKKVSGQPLAELIDAAKGFSERLALLPHVLRVAEAVAYAHERGIIHRDLKPANVLVGELGETMVVDWGLAKRVSEDDLERSSDGAQEDETQTRAGDVMGTPAYMAPEQAAGRAVDARSDVYSLGAMLHHVLTGRAPKKGRTDLLELRDRVPDLVTIVGKSMAEEPSQRYASAGALAEELLRFQTGQLVGAHRYSLRALVARWIRRRRAVVAVAAILGVLLVVVATVSIKRIIRERDAANAARAAAEDARADAETRQRALILLQARAELERDPTASIAWLKTYPHTTEDFRDERRIAADAWTRGVARHVFRGPHAFTAVAISTDARVVAATDSEGALFVWDVATGARRLFDGAGPIVALSTDGRAAATSDRKGMVRTWDLQTGTSKKLQGTHIASLLTFSKDGAFVLGINPVGGAYLWDALSSEERPLPPKSSAASFLPDGRALAVAHELLLEVIDLRTGAVATQEKLDATAVEVVASEDGRWLAATANDHVLLLDRAKGTRRKLSPEADLGRILRFSGDGKWAATCGHSSSAIWFFDLETGKGQPLGDEGCVRRGFAFSPDGSLVTLGNGRSVNLWELGSKRKRSLLGHEGAVVDAAVSGDGSLLASAGTDGTVRVFRLREGDVWLWDPKVPSLPGAPSSMAAWLDSVTTAQVDPQGHLASP